MMIKGIAASEGIGIGTVKIVTTSPRDIEYYVPENKADEINRYNEALDGFCADTEKMAAELSEAASEKEAEILKGHIQMIRDPFVTSQITDEIESGSCAEAAAEKVLNSVIEMFKATGDQLTMERATDVADIKARLIMHLQGIEDVNLSRVPVGTVIVTDDLTPSMTVGISGDQISGIITAKGGYTSHSAILSRSLGIPAVLSVRDILASIKDGDQVIVDGSEGLIVISPTEADSEKYAKKAAEYKEMKQRLQAFKGKPSVTADGELREIVANIGSPADGVIAKNDDAEGIGLLRTEFLYMSRPSAPLEEEQFEAYKKVAETFGDKPVIIRTLDIGGDKEVPYLNLPKEDNPFMGYRAIRFCLNNHDLFQAQLKALLRASAYGNVRIMIPMITTVDEVREVKKLRDQCIEDLTREGKKFNPDTPLGIMVETPAASIIADRLALEVDFFSIGTNDLTGYTMAADRGNSQVQNLYSAFDPAVLRSIKRICSCAHNAGIPVGMCGEAASDPALIPVLLAFGLDEFSVSHEKVLSTRYNLSLWNKIEAEHIARHALARDSASSIRRYLNDKVKRRITK
jgi:phosphotransferase system enzyme I (PtsI)